MSHPVPTISYEQYSVLSQEIAFLERFSAISSKVKESVLAFMNSSRNVLGSNEVNADAVSVALNTDRITNTIAGRYILSMPYTTSRKLVTFIPVGFQGSMTAYMDVLLDGLDYFSRLEADVLDPAIRYISTAIAKPETLGGAGAPRQTPDWLNKWSEQVVGFSGRNLTTDVTLFGDIYKSNTEFFDSYSKGVKLTELESKLPSGRSVQNKVDELVKLFDKLMIKMEANTELYKVNGTNAQGLTDLSYTLARAVELYSVFLTTAKAAIVALEKTEEKFTAIGKSQFGS